MICKYCNKEIPEGSVFCSLCGRSQNGTLPAAMSKRFVNSFIDSLVWLFLLVGTFLLLFLLVHAHRWLIGVLLAYLGPLLFMLGYYLICEAIWGRTIGKLVTKTKVVMRDGSKPDFLHILGRTFGRLIPYEAFSFLFIPAGWHDLVSKTYVVPLSYTADDVQRIDTKLREKSRGRTVVIVLVCILFAIGVFGIIASVAIATLGSVRDKARDSIRISDVNTIVLAVDAYAKDHKGVYPTSLNPSLMAPYLSQISTDPTTGKPYGYIVDSTVKPKSFVVWAELEGYSAFLQKDDDITGSGFDGSIETCSRTPGVIDCIYDIGRINGE